MSEKRKIEFEEEFLSEAKVIRRKGASDLVKYLQSTDFFEAPASTKYHNSFEGGLVGHSLGVLDVLKELDTLLDCRSDSDSLRICGLFHDICKANFYVKETRNKKINGSWQEVEVWAVKEQLPMGHGEKSVYLIQKHMELTDDEAIAIRWHLGGFDPGTHFGFPSGFSQQKAFKTSKLTALLAGADLLATYLVDNNEED